MQYTRLGSTGTKVSRICLGMMSYGSPKWRPWTLDEDQGRPFVRRAYELGINFFDTADMYSVGISEEVTGRLLREVAPRDEVVVATKVFHPMGDRPNQRGLSRKHIMEAIDASLKRLGMDYVDLYIIHRWDYETPIEETLEALNDVVRAGKALYIGASSMYAWQFTKALYTADLHGWTRMVSMQNLYNLAYREEEREMIPLCIAEGVGITPWSPLARGFLTGKYTRDKMSDTKRAETDDYLHASYGLPEDYDVAERVVEVAAKRGVSPAQVALAWTLNKPGIDSPIVGATKMQHLEEAVAAVDITLSDEEIAVLEEPYQPHRIIGYE
ncbi:MAG: aldo/keto reductase [Anaerolineae bacterium]|nr:aldo/keto reductase [Anaerolineae bacterium]